MPKRRRAVKRGRAVYEIGKTKYQPTQQELAVQKRQQEMMARQNRPAFSGNAYYNPEALHARNEKLRAEQEAVANKEAQRQQREMLAQPGEWEKVKARSLQHILDVGDLDPNQLLFINNFASSPEQANSIREWLKIKPTDRYRPQAMEAWTILSKMPYDQETRAAFDEIYDAEDEDLYPSFGQSFRRTYNRITESITKPIFKGLQSVGVPGAGGALAILDELSGIANIKWENRDNLFRNLAETAVHTGKAGFEAYKIAKGGSVHRRMRRRCVLLSKSKLH
jgi:hypothetical protein